MFIQLRQAGLPPLASNDRIPRMTVDVRGGNMPRIEAFFRVGIPEVAFSNPAHLGTSPPYHRDALCEVVAELRA
ncbi:hypothetical protein PQR67_37185 [Paraburkholderia fungorum]|uniref:hypothetical protein n=1 Tax=Paraburkholderia fungorum TaxID=134537 RepID=UPI0038B9EE6B